MLQSELKRIKSRLAADAGEDDLVAFLLSDNAEDATFVSDLRKRLACVIPHNDRNDYSPSVDYRTAEEKSTALEQSLATLQQEDSNAAAQAKAEAKLREELAHIRRRLEKYQAVYGEASSALPPDMQTLSQRLQEKEDEIKRVQLQQKQRDQVCLGL